MKWRLIKIVIVIILITLSVVWGWGQYTLLQQTKNKQIDLFSVSQSISSIQADSAISVDGDADLVSQAGPNGWAFDGRDGSAEKPFGIWAQNITTGISGRLISILNTNLYIDIYFCTLSGDDYGIYLDNVKNILIRDSFIEDSATYGIRISGGSSNINVTGNTITSTLTNRGVSVSASSHVLISGNTISSNGDGVVLSSSNHTRVEGNTIQKNRNNGIYTNFAYYNTISDNTINSSWYYQSGTYGNGMRIVNSVNTSISKNTVHGNVGSGIIVTTNTYNTTIDDNEIYNHTKNSGSSGILHWDTAYNSTITNNVLYDNNYGIQANDWHVIINNTINNSIDYGIYLNSWNTANNNTLFNNSRGIYIEDTHNSLSHNKIYNSTTYGIELYSAFDTTLVHNTIENSGSNGIRIYYTQRTTIKDNILNNNDILIDGSIYAQFAQAEVSNNLLNGNPLIFWKDLTGPLTVPSYTEQVFIFNCTNIEITGLHLSDVYSGIIIHSSNNVSIHDNTISSCTYTALDIYSTNNSRITNNIFSDTGQVICGTVMENLTISGNFFLRNSGSTNGIIDLHEINNSKISENEFYDNMRFAIAIFNGFENTLKSNIIHNQSSGSGILLQYQVNTTVYWNSISNCSEKGIQIVYGSNNSVFTNEFTNNTQYGVYIFNSNWNVVMFNNFLNNSMGNPQAYDSGSYNVFKKNYWNDELGIDADEDGYLDGKTYSLDGGANFDPLLLANHYLPTFPTILFPNGEETLSGNVTIQWTAASDPLNNLFTYNLYYSLNNGVSWIEIAKDLDVTSYLWNTLTLTNSSNYLLKITAFYQEVTYKEVRIILEDISDDFFTTENVGHYLTVPVITKPIGGDSVSGVISIQWAASTDSWNYKFPISYDLYYSNDLGTSWTSLGTLSSPGYLWNTSKVTDGLTYQIMVRAWNNEGLERTAISEVFIIQNHLLSEPIVLYPSGGEVIGGLINIQWSASIDSLGHSLNYSVYYSSDGGGSWTPIAEGLEVTNIEWDTTTVSDGENYVIKVIVTDELGFTNEDSSDSSFTILNIEPQTTTHPTTPTTTPTTPTTTPPTESSSETTIKTSTDSSTTQDGSTPGWTGYSLLVILGVITLIRRRSK
ncbi:MAG: right-handed parallel beta-helix repeat-containing protein [Promethearchaeota archaeon]